MSNPLLSDWNTPFELPPFAAIDDSHFAPALDEALEAARANIAAICACICAVTLSNSATFPSAMVARST